MANHWFFIDDDGNKHGPHTAETLKKLALDGTIRPETVIETGGGKRAPAGNVKGLFDKPPKPPEPKRGQGVSVVPMPAADGEETGGKKPIPPQALAVWIAAAAVILLGLLVAVGISVRPAKGPQEAPAVALHPDAMPKERKVENFEENIAAERNPLLDRLTERRQRYLHSLAVIKDFAETAFFFGMSMEDVEAMLKLSTQMRGRFVENDPKGRILGNGMCLDSAFIDFEKPNSQRSHGKFLECTWEAFPGDYRVTMQIQFYDDFAKEFKVTGMPVEYSKIAPRSYIEQWKKVPLAPKIPATQEIFEKLKLGMTMTEVESIAGSCHASGMETASLFTGRWNGSKDQYGNNGWFELAFEDRMLTTKMPIGTLDDGDSTDAAAKPKEVFGNPYHLFQEGRLLAMDGEFEQANEKLTNAVLYDVDKKQIEWRYCLFATRYRMGITGKDAAKYIENIMNMDAPLLEDFKGIPGKMDIKELKAACAFFGLMVKSEGEGDLDEATRWANAILELFPFDIEVRYNRAHMLFKQEKNKAAFDDLIIVLKEEPRFSPGLSMFATILAETEKFDAAIKAIDNAIKYAPDREYREFYEEKKRKILEAQKRDKK